MSAFMKPYYRNDTFVSVEVDGPDTVAEGIGPMPAGDFDPRHHLPKGWTEYTVTKETGWHYRLSADGFLDATDWHGPFPTLRACREDVVSSFDVHPDTGEELPSGDDGAFCAHTKCATWTPHEPRNLGDEAPTALCEACAAHMADHGSIRANNGIICAGCTTEPKS